MHPLISSHSSQHLSSAGRSFFNTKPNSSKQQGASSLFILIAIVLIVLSRNLHDLPSEGFFFVEAGTILLNTATRELTIYESQDLSTAGTQAVPCLTIDLTAVADLEVECRRIRSANCNYGSGRIQISGTFQQFKERLTFKMVYEHFVNMKEALQSMA